MTVLIATAFVLAGVVLSLLQVQWAYRTPHAPTRFQDIGASLSSRTRNVSNVAIALLLFTGVALLIGDQPWWVRWPAFLVSAAVTAGIQVVALTLRRRRALAAPSTTDGPTPADGAR